LTARKNLAELVGAAAAPDVRHLKIEDRTVPSDPDAPVRIYRPQRAQGAIVELGPLCDAAWPRDVVASDRLEEPAECSRPTRSMWSVSF
jgi:hypothetical protein